MTKNHNGNIFSPHLELFNGGSWGGVHSILTYEARGFTSILEKDTFSRLHVGRSWVGAEMGGGGWGATFGIHGGALGGVPIVSEAFLTQNSRFFEMDVIQIIK